MGKHHLLSSLGSLSKLHETTNSQTIKSRFVDSHRITKRIASQRQPRTMAGLKLSATLGQVNAERNQNSIIKKVRQRKKGKSTFIDCATVRSTVKQSAKYDGKKAKNLANNQTGTNELRGKETNDDPNFFKTFNVLCFNLLRFIIVGG